MGEVEVQLLLPRYSTNTVYGGYLYNTLLPKGQSALQSQFHHTHKLVPTYNHQEHCRVLTQGHFDT